MAQGTVSPYARRSDPSGLCSVPDPFAGGVGYPAVRGYRYEGHTGTAGKGGFNLADFGKELLTGFVAGGLSSAAFYGAGKAVEAVKGSVRGTGKGGTPTNNDYIPRDENGNIIPLKRQMVNGRDIPLPDPEAQGRPHTVLGGATSSKTGVDYRQSATFGGETWPSANGYDVPLYETHWYNHGRGDHAIPHKHIFYYDSSDGGWQRGGPSLF